MKTLLAVSTAALVLFAAGCGGDDDEGSSSEGSSSAAAPAAQAGSSAAVDIKDFTFTPGDLTVKTGTKVEWENLDSSTHNVIADDGDFKSEDLAQGDTFSYTADKAGSFSYICSFHPNMKATLNVTD